MKKNISYNCNESGVSDVYDKHKSVIIQKLDWCNLSECDLFSEHFKIDVLLASDIIFDPEIIPSLVETISFLTNLNSQVPGVTFGFFRYDATTIGLSVVKA